MTAVTGSREVHGNLVQRRDEAALSSTPASTLAGRKAAVAKRARASIENIFQLVAEGLACKAFPTSQIADFVSLGKMVEGLKDGRAVKILEETDFFIHRAEGGWILVGLIGALFESCEIDFPVHQEDFKAFLLSQKPLLDQIQKGLLDLCKRSVARSVDDRLLFDHAYTFGELLPLGISVLSNLAIFFVELQQKRNEASLPFPLENIKAEITRLQSSVVTTCLRVSEAAKSALVSNSSSTSKNSVLYDTFASFFSTIRKLNAIKNSPPIHSKDAPKPVLPQPFSQFQVEGVTSLTAAVINSVMESYFDVNDAIAAVEGNVEALPASWKEKLASTQTLKLEGLALTYSKLKKLGACCPTLQELHIENCTLQGSLVQFKFDNVLVIPKQMISYFWSACTFQVHGSPCLIPNSSLRDLIESFPSEYEEAVWTLYGTLMQDEAQKHLDGTYEAALNQVKDGLSKVFKSAMLSAT